MAGKTSVDQRHQCGAPGCRRRILLHYFACSQHRGLLEWEFHVRLQTAYQERLHRPHDFSDLRRQALKVWGWKEEPCPK